MREIRLALPSLAYKEGLLDYRREFIENNEVIHGSAGLGNAKTFEEWYKAFQDNLKEETVREGLVPSTTYLGLDDKGNIVGMIDIRHRLNPYLLKHGGHIGYSVRKSKRNQGYATKMLSLALEACKRLEIKEVLVTCDKENIASAKTIINNGGQLENELPEEDRITKRYWIRL